MNISDISNKKEYELQKKTPKIYWHKKKLKIKKKIKVTTDEHFIHT